MNQLTHTNHNPSLAPVPRPLLIILHYDGLDRSIDQSILRFPRRQKNEIACDIHTYTHTQKKKSLCGQHHRALKLFLQCGKQEVEAAIAVVGKARNDMLTHTLIDFLMGETDGVPKDPNYIYRLYMALGSYSQVSPTTHVPSAGERRGHVQAR